MRILLTNDDGLHAEGLHALHAELARHHDVSVVAPMREYSAGGHAISTATAMRVRKVPFSGGMALAVDGTPADCVKLALAEFTRGRKPDLVVAGINHGANVGICVLYSGTVSAALEGAIEGLPAFAVSALMRRNTLPDFASVAARFRPIAERILADGARPGIAYNVNFPDRAMARARGVRWAPQSRQLPFLGHFVRRKDPGGRPYYWLTESARPVNGDRSTDVSFLSRGYVTVTPLAADLTRHDLLPGPSVSRKGGSRGKAP